MIGGETTIILFLNGTPFKTPDRNLDGGRGNLKDFKQQSIFDLSNLYNLTPSNKYMRVIQRERGE